MGFREKVTLIIIVLVILQITANCLKLSQKYTTRPRPKSNASLRKHALQFNPLQTTRKLQNYGGQTEKYGESIRKKFEFPEIEYSGISKCFLNYPYQKSNRKVLSSKDFVSTQDSPYTLHNAFSTCGNNDIKNNVNSNTKQQQGIAPLPEFSYTPNYRVFGNFPDVEYPLCVSEIWKPYYWNSYLIDTPSSNNLFSSDKKFNRNMIEQKPFANLIKNYSCVFDKGSKPVMAVIDKNFNMTLDSKQTSFNVSSYNKNATNIKKCEDTSNEDKEQIILSRSEDCSNELLQTEDKKYEFVLKDEDFTTDNPESEESSSYSQSTVAPQTLSNNDHTWQNTKVVEYCLPDMDELKDYFVSV